MGDEAEKPPTKGAKCLSCLKGNALTIGTVIGVVMGGVVGTILKYCCKQFTPRQVMYVEFPGKLFLQMLKGLIIPLITSSLVSAIANLDISLSKKIAFRAIIYYLTTVFAAVCLGIAVVCIMRPGLYHVEKKSNEDTPDVLKRNITTVDTLLDLVKNMFPANVVKACLDKEGTELVPTTDKNTNKTKSLMEWDIKQKTIPGTNVMALVVVSVILGIALAQLGEETHTFKLFFDDIMTISMKVTKWVIWLSPLGVFFLVTAKIVEMKDISEVLVQLGMYFATVLVGLFVQSLIVLPLLYFLLTRKNPFVFLLHLGTPLVTAFGTASSSATLPITIQCLEERCGIDSRIARFCLPIGSAINMDGTALYEAVAAIFIAQVRKVDMDIGTYIAVSITATAASIGAAGIPQAGLVTMVMVLDTVGLPADDVSMILAVDCDRVRTTVNVIGDSFGAAIVYYRSLKELGRLPESS